MLFVLLVLVGGAASAQEKNINDAYQQFMFSRMTKGNDVLIEQTRGLLARAKELNAKRQANVAYHLGRMYEEVGKPDSALVYYAQSLKGEPNYSVIHRALGFIYLNQSKVFVAQMNAANAAKNADANAKAYNQYKAVVLKALPHLEKYQACDPDDETLDVITNLYKSIKDSQAVATLPARLKTLAGTCVSLLEDE